MFRSHILYLLYHPSLIVSDTTYSVYVFVSALLADVKFLNDISCVSTISVRDEFLLVGTFNGHVKLYINDCRKIHEQFRYVVVETHELFSRYVTMFDWNIFRPNLVAVASNENSVCIMELLPDVPQIKLHTRIVIKSSRPANNWVKWSFSVPDQLLTCGGDGVVRVWTVSPESSPKQTFEVQFNSPMNCAIFLPNAPKYMMCAGRNTTLEFIEIREMDANELKTSPKASHVRTLDNIHWAAKVLIDINKRPVSMNLLNCSHRPQSNSQKLLRYAAMRRTVEDLSDALETTNGDASNPSNSDEEWIKNEGEAAVSANPEELVNLLETVTLNPVATKKETTDFRGSFLKVS